ncbi:hypothetical protein JTB14_026792 [Gonioctena quinquepunctata]|nr:hypothetical protein JTB14_026792 [Gonioctena quinquepunctata]
MEEIRAIFKGLAEELDPNEIAKELINEGFTLRIVARFENREGKPMPIILVFVPGSQHEIKNLNKIMELDVHFEHRRRKGRLGQRYPSQKFGHSAVNCKTDPVCRHCAVIHESRQHNKDEEGPNKLVIVEGLTKQTTEDAKLSKL